MKRFYDRAEARDAAGGFEIALDGRPVKTPARAPLVMPQRHLAEAIAGEWASQGEDIDPRSMPLTGLANAALDRVSADPESFAFGLARYGETDLLCYRAESPPPLVARQAEQWDPILDWARHRFDVDFHVTAGVIHRPQPEQTVRTLARAVASRDSFALAALSPLVTIAGSLVLALALAERAFDFQTIWAAATLDEAWQAEQWGEDTEASRMLANRRTEFESAFRFLELSESA
jgi:chaperone required for assembly of F1-ATPase